MYSIEFSPAANKFFQKLPKNDQLLISKKIDSLKEDPIRYLKKLQGSKFWRLRIKDYRAVVDVIISGKKIVVVRFGHRKNVY